MTRKELEQYCKDNGVPYRLVGDQLRVMDQTQLPEAMRANLDKSGLYVEPKTKKEAKAEVKAAESEEETEPAKKGKK